MAVGSVMRLFKSATSSLRSAVTEHVAPQTATYLQQRGWAGNEAAREGAMLIAQARVGLVVRPVVNRAPETALRWLREGGELIGADQGIGNVFRQRGRPMLHWVSIQLLAPGPVDDALAVARRTRLGQDRFGGAAFQLRTSVLDDADVLRTSWFSTPEPARGTIDELDQVLFDRRLLERETAAGGRATTKDTFENLRSMGTDGIHDWLSDGLATAASPGHVFKPKLDLDPIEAISTHVVLDDVIGIRAEPGTSARDVKALRKAAAERGIPFTHADPA